MIFCCVFLVFLMRGGTPPSKVRGNHRLYWRFTVEFMYNPPITEFWTKTRITAGVSKKSNHLCQPQLVTYKILQNYWSINQETSLSLICLERDKFTRQYHIWFATYKYCKFERSPSCETSVPERFAFPRLLSKCKKHKKKKRINYSTDGHSFIKLQVKMTYQLTHGSHGYHHCM
jgi:hypothetical protein